MLHCHIYSYSISDCTRGFQTIAKFTSLLNGRADAVSCTVICTHSEDMFSIWQQYLLTCSLFTIIFQTGDGNLKIPARTLYQMTLHIRPQKLRAERHKKSDWHFSLMQTTKTKTDLALMFWLQKNKTKPNRHCHLKFT